jgi:DNA-binding NtrC family response regulator
MEEPVTPVPQTVLVVDDEVEDRQLMRVTLREAGHTVLEASNFHSAMNKFAQYRDDISLLISDVSLPDINGCELAKTILQARPDMKVLLVSGQAGAEVCRFYGVTRLTLHLLEKPFKPIELLMRAYRVILSSEKMEVSSGGAANPTLKSMAG